MLFTIGYSNHDLEDLLDLLRQQKINALADVRSHPISRYRPQFNHRPLADALRAAAIHYVFMGRELGARREEPECYLAGVAEYDLIAGSPLFARGLNRLREGLRSHRIALLCAEGDPLECHRAILICRNLRSELFPIRHIHPDGHLETHPELEQRLMERLGVVPDLFTGPDRMEELVERAYAEQSRRIAHRDKNDHDNFTD